MNQKLYRPKMYQNILALNRSKTDLKRTRLKQFLFVPESNTIQNRCEMKSWLQGRKEKSKYGYVVRKNLDFDKAELLLYEPVEKMPPFSRKTLVFVSPPGIGKQQLVHKLVDSNHDMFGRPIPCKPLYYYLQDATFDISICYFSPRYYHGLFYGQTFFQGLS